MDRRGFLKRAGGAVLTVVAAPLFIPSERLDFGVPRRIIAPEPEIFTIRGGEVMVDRFTLKTLDCELFVDELMLKTQRGLLKREAWEMKARAVSREYSQAFFGDPLPEWLEPVTVEEWFPDSGMAYDSAPGVDTFGEPSVLRALGAMTDLPEQLAALPLRVSDGLLRYRVETTLPSLAWRRG